jgi:hypothetical protein
MRGLFLIPNLLKFKDTKIKDVFKVIFIHYLLEVRGLFLIPSPIPSP